MLMANSARPARLHYMMNGFRVLAPGEHVVCAVTGAPIALQDLRYWSVDRQEPYASARIATEAFANAPPRR